MHKDLKRTLNQRISKTADIVNQSNDQWIIWTLKNDEANELNKVINDSVNVQGSDKPNVKASNLNGFARNDFKTLITKTSIASFGMNYQNCCNMIFTSYDFKFEAFYQAVRRCYRFGQNKEVNVHLLIPESQMNVRKTILEKQQKHQTMIKQMSKYSANTNYKLNKSNIVVKNKEVQTDDYHCINGDCVIETSKLNDNCADLLIFSPPFADLYAFRRSHLLRSCIVMFFHNQYPSKQEMRIFPTNQQVNNLQHWHQYLDVV